MSATRFYNLFIDVSQAQPISAIVSKQIKDQQSVPIPQIIAFQEPSAKQPGTQNNTPQQSVVQIMPPIGLSDPQKQQAQAQSPVVMAIRQDIEGPHTATNPSPRDSTLRTVYKTQANALLSPSQKMTDTKLLENGSMPVSSGEPGSGARDSQSIDHADIDKASTTQKPGIDIPKVQLGSKCLSQRQDAKETIGKGRDVSGGRQGCQQLEQTQRTTRRDSLDISMRHALSLCRPTNSQEEVQRSPFREDFFVLTKPEKILEIGNFRNLDGVEERDMNWFRQRSSIPSYSHVNKVKLPSKHTTKSIHKHFEDTRITRLQQKIKQERRMFNQTATNFTGKFLPSQNIGNLHHRRETHSSVQQDSLSGHPIHLSLNGSINSKPTPNAKKSVNLVDCLRDPKIRVDVLALRAGASQGSAASNISYESTGSQDVIMGRRKINVKTANLGPSKLKTQIHHLNLKKTTEPYPVDPAEMLKASFDIGGLTESLDIGSQNVQGCHNGHKVVLERPKQATRGPNKNIVLERIDITEDSESKVGQEGTGCVAEDELSQDNPLNGYIIFDYSQSKAQINTSQLSKDPTQKQLVQAKKLNIEEASVQNMAEKSSSFINKPQIQQNGGDIQRSHDLSNSNQGIVSKLLTQRVGALSTTSSPQAGHQKEPTQPLSSDQQSPRYLQNTDRTEMISLAKDGAASMEGEGLVNGQLDLSKFHQDPSDLINQKHLVSHLNHHPVETPSIPPAYLPPETGALSSQAPSHLRHPSLSPQPLLILSGPQILDQGRSALGLTNQGLGATAGGGAPVRIVRGQKMEMNHGSIISHTQRQSVHIAGTRASPQPFILNRQSDLSPPPILTCKSIEKSKDKETDPAAQNHKSPSDYAAPNDISRGIRCSQVPKQDSKMKNEFANSTLSQRAANSVAPTISNFVNLPVKQLELTENPTVRFESHLQEASAQLTTSQNSQQRNTRNSTQQGTKMNNNNLNNQKVISTLQRNKILQNPNKMRSDPQQWPSLVAPVSKSRFIQNQKNNNITPAGARQRHQKMRQSDILESRKQHELHLQKYQTSVTPRKRQQQQLEEGSDYQPFVAAAIASNGSLNLQQYSVIPPPVAGKNIQNMLLQSSSSRSKGGGNDSTQNNLSGLDGVFNVQKLEPIIVATHYQQNQLNSQNFPQFHSNGSQNLSKQYGSIDKTPNQQLLPSIRSSINSVQHQDSFMSEQGATNSLSSNKAANQFRDRQVLKIIQTNKQGQDFTQFAQKQLQPQKIQVNPYDRTSSMDKKLMNSPITKFCVMFIQKNNNTALGVPIQPTSPDTLTNNRLMVAKNHRRSTLSSFSRQHTSGLNYTLPEMDPNHQGQQSLTLEQPAPTSAVKDCQNSKTIYQTFSGDKNKSKDSHMELSRDKSEQMERRQESSYSRIDGKLEPFKSDNNENDECIKSRSRLCSKSKSYSKSPRNQETHTVNTPKETNKNWLMLSENQNHNIESQALNEKVQRAAQSILLNNSSATSEHQIGADNKSKKNVTAATSPVSLLQRGNEIDYNQNYVFNMPNVKDVSNFAPGRATHTQNFGVFEQSLIQEHISATAAMMNQTTKAKSMVGPHKKKASPVPSDPSSATNKFTMMQMLDKLSKKIATEYSSSLRPMGRRNGQKGVSAGANKLPAFNTNQPIGKKVDPQALNTDILKNDRLRNGKKAKIPFEVQPFASNSKETCNSNQGLPQQGQDSGRISIHESSIPKNAETKSFFSFNRKIMNMDMAARSKQMNNVSSDSFRATALDLSQHRTQVFKSPLHTNTLNDHLYFHNPSSRLQHGLIVLNHTSKLVFGPAYDAASSKMTIKSRTLNGIYTQKHKNNEKRAIKNNGGSQDRSDYPGQKQILSIYLDQKNPLNSSENTGTNNSSIFPTAQKPRKSTIITEKVSLPADKKMLQAKLSQQTRNDSNSKVLQFSSNRDQSFEQYPTSVSRVEPTASQNMPSKMKSAELDLGSDEGE